MNIGDRVGAIQCVEQGKMKLFGYGKLVGTEVPDGAVGPVAQIASLMGRTSPKILLDSGQVVWGCECWWAPEDEIRAMARVYERRKAIVQVDIDELRREYMKSLS